MFSYGFCQISKNTFFTEHLRATASEVEILEISWWWRPRGLTRASSPWYKKKQSISKDPYFSKLRSNFFFQISFEINRKRKFRFFKRKMSGRKKRWAWLLVHKMAFSIAYILRQSQAFHGYQATILMIPSHYTKLKALWMCHFKRARFHFPKYYFFIKDFFS